MYHHLFYGQTKTDSSLIYGQPRSIRTDEWLVNSQMTLAQDQAGYPRINNNIGSGMDMSVLGDVPYKEWSVAFKPQYWGFFVLPLEYAFALKWWFLLFMLIVSCYFFTLRLLNGKKVLSILLALGFGLSPFVAWWYISGTLACLFYGFLIMILLMRMINDEKIPRVTSRLATDVLHISALGYLLAAFALLMYPPFQISVALVVIIFSVGYLLKKTRGDKHTLKSLSPSLLKIAASGLIALTVVLAFVFTRADTFNTIQDTVYPGPRTKASTAIDPLFVFNAFLQPQLQREPEGYYFLGNQSESGNFILLLPLLVLPGFAILIYNYRKHRKVDWLLLTIQLGIVLLLIRAFAPGVDPLYKLFSNHLPHERPIMAFGLIGYLQILLIIRALRGTKVKHPIAIALYGLASFAFLMLIGNIIRTKYPLFIQSWKEIGFLALGFAAIPVLLLYRKFVIAASVLLAFTLLSTWKINPLYQGLGPLTNDQLSQTIQRVSKPQDTWVGVDSAYIENIGLVNNRHSISGVNFYPLMDYWRQVGGSTYDHIYNRYAHIVFTTNPEQTAPFALGAADFITVKLMCSDFITREVDYAVSVKPIELACAHHLETITHPAMSFYIYKIAK